MTSLPVVIPSDFDIVVSKDDTVQIGQVLARKKHAPSEVLIPLARRLKISPKSIGRFLKKSTGDFVERGDVLAQKDGLFGDKVAVSNVAGTLAKVDQMDGSIVIRFPQQQVTGSDTEEVLCPLDGTVAICHNGQIVLETDKNVLFGDKGTGQTFRGILKLSDVKSKAAISAEKITVEAIDSVLFGPAFTTEAFAKASAIGVGGILTLELEDEDVAYIQEKRLSLPVVQINEELGKAVSKWKNKEIFIDGGNKAILLLSYEKSTR